MKIKIKIDKFEIYNILMLLFKFINDEEIDDKGAK